MSRKPCLFALSLVLPACIEPAVQGTSLTADADSQGDSGGGSTTEATDEATTADATSASGGPASGDPSSGAPSTCSDGALDPGEHCDDGDADDSDECTSKCAPPSCEDGLVNAGESDVDCGGPCKPCPGGQTCVDPSDCSSGLCQAATHQCLPLVRSCLELLDALPGLPDGDYPIDPDGDAALPITVTCDMKGGGWTQVFLDEFTPQQPGWNKVDVTECGIYGAVFGGAGKFGAGATARLETAARAVVHEELRVVVEAVIIDTWDTEALRVKLDDVEVASQTCVETDVASCGQTQNECGIGMFREGKVVLAPPPVAHTQDAIKLDFESTLNEGADNEAWGLDRVALLVR